MILTYTLDRWECANCFLDTVLAVEWQINVSICHPSFGRVFSPWNNSDSYYPSECLHPDQSWAYVRTWERAQIALSSKCVTLSLKASWAAALYKEKGFTGCTSTLLGHLVLGSGKYSEQKLTVLGENAMNSQNARLSLKVRWILFGNPWAVILWGIMNPLEFLQRWHGTVA